MGRVSFFMSLIDETHLFIQIFYFKSTDFFFSISAALLENELVDQICQHFLRILRQSKQENEAELLMLLDILHLFLTNCENNVSVN